MENIYLYLDREALKNGEKAAIDKADEDYNDAEKGQSLLYDIDTKVECSEITKSGEVSLNLPDCKLGYISITWQPTLSDLAALMEILTKKINRAKNVLESIEEN